ncbi:hypothetical protein DNTS_028627 [Danionella cerebrum]|uniref:Uncharacterized protein n=1 Tax=Danionella cerebrum TaxID=2873325 RepID=A0A553MUB5_9TELE|nr:hypothetical protein DNTS_028627 [Danionella translucida]
MVLIIIILKTSIATRHIATITNNLEHNLLMNMKRRDGSGHHHPNNQHSNLQDKHHASKKKGQSRVSVTKSAGSSSTSLTKTSSSSSSDSSSDSSSSCSSTSKTSISNSSFSSSSCSSSCSSWASDASLDKLPFSCGSKRSSHCPRYSWSCVDISRGRRAFEDDENCGDVMPLLDADGQLKISKGVEKSLIVNEKGRETLKKKSQKDSQREKNNYAQQQLCGKGSTNIRKTKSMEVLSRKGYHSSSGELDEKTLEKRKKDAHKNFVKEKMKFSAFLNEITLQVLSPSRLSSLGVTNVQRPTSPGQTSISSKTMSPRPEHKRDKGSKTTRRRVGSTASTEASIANSHASKHSHTSKHSHSKHKAHPQKYYNCNKHSCSEKDLSREQLQQGIPRHNNSESDSSNSSYSSESYSSSAEQSHKRQKPQTDSKEQSDSHHHHYNHNSPNPITIALIQSLIIIMAKQTIITIMVIQSLTTIILMHHLVFIITTKALITVMPIKTPNTITVCLIPLIVMFIRNLITIPPIKIHIITINHKKTLITSIPSKAFMLIMTLIIINHIQNLTAINPILIFIPYMLIPNLIPINLTHTVITIKPIQTLITIKLIQTLITIKPIQTLITIKPIQTLITIKPIQTLITIKPIQTLITIKPIQTLITIKPIQTLITIKPIQTLITIKPIQTLITIKPIQTLITIKPIQTLITIKPIQTFIRIKLIQTPISIKPILTFISIKPIQMDVTSIIIHPIQNLRNIPQHHIDIYHSDSHSPASLHHQHGVHHNQTLFINSGTQEHNSEDHPYPAPPGSHYHHHPFSSPEHCHNSHNSSESNHHKTYSKSNPFCSSPPLHLQCSDYDSSDTKSHQQTLHHHSLPHKISNSDHHNHASVSESESSLCQSHFNEHDLVEDPQSYRRYSPVGHRSISPHSIKSDSSASSTIQDDQSTVSYQDPSSFPKEKNAELEKLMMLKEQNEVLHHSLLQTTVRMECMGAEFKTGHQLLESELQRTRIELNTLMEHFTKLQNNYSCTQQNNHLLEKKLHCVAQCMDGEREQLNLRISELTEQLSSAKTTIQSLETMHVTSMLQDALVKHLKADESMPPHPIAPPPSQFIDHFDKVSMYADDLPLGTLQEEEESDWSEIGEEVQNYVPRGSQGNYQWQQGQVSWERMSQYCKGNVDTGSESGGEETFCHPHGLQIPHLKFTVHPETLPVPTTDVSLARFKQSPNGPACDLYSITEVRTLGSPIRVLSASLEEIHSIGLQQEDHGSLRSNKSMMDLHQSQVDTGQVSNDVEIVSNWIEVDSQTKGEDIKGITDLKSAQKMLNHFVHEGESTHL